MGMVLLVWGCAEGGVTSVVTDAGGDGSTECGPDACVVGERSCLGSFAFVDCIDDGSGCGVLTEPIACGLSKLCTEGACEAPTACEDADGDGYGEGCVAGGDCDDTDPERNGGVQEVCGDNIDNNCRDGVDESCTVSCDSAPCNVGDTRCGSGNMLETCVADADGCGTWDGGVACATDSSCADGVCVAPSCGDGTCQSSESCSNCQQDCGDCCGNGSCDNGETCSSCQQDCGGCCGNGSCDNGETCSSCEQDCGACGPVCGDNACETGETCSSCSDCQNGHMGKGENGDPCPSSLPRDRWRCVFSDSWGLNVSQFCRDGKWVSWHLNPRNCSACVCDLGSPGSSGAVACDQ